MFWRDSPAGFQSQCNPSSTRKHGGVGLGLVLTKKLIDGMNGNIWMQSEAGRGSAVSFTVVLGIKENYTRV